ncbi:MAG: monovalent cation/H+ antiporter subunit D family protein [Pseudomonadota bacterium]
MDIDTLIILALATPFAAGIWSLAIRTNDNLRDGGTFLATILLFGVALQILWQFNSGVVPHLSIVEFGNGLSIAFSVEPLGMVFALVASSLWILTHIYGLGYMRGNKEKKQGRFFACFGFAIFATMGIAFAENLLTLFLFYELLTVSTYPLVAHKETDEAKQGARTYLGILMGTSIVFLLTAVVWTFVITGNLDFRQGGIFPADIDPVFMAVLLGLFAFGIGKAALMPFHRWLPAAMVAPTPVSALLHAVAVVKAGVFSMVKIGVYVFGIDNLAATGASNWLMWLAAFSILVASVVAMMQDNLKRRLAYSTVSQLSYITLGVALATSTGALGGSLHIVTHAFGKITLFMCAGAIYVATHKTNISEMRGLGRAMPFTFVAFGIGALSIIGLPPLAGSWSKWSLLLGAADAGQQIMLLVLMISSILNVAYLLPIFANGFFSPATGQGSKALNSNDVPWRERLAEAPLFCVLPPCITAICCLILFFYAGEIETFLRPILAIPQ